MNIYLIYGRWAFSKLAWTESRIRPVLIDCEIKRNLRIVFIYEEKVFFPIHLTSSIIVVLKTKLKDTISSDIPSLVICIITLPTSQSLQIFPFISSPFLPLVENVVDNAEK